MYLMLMLFTDMSAVFSYMMSSLESASLPPSWPLESAGFFENMNVKRQMEKHPKDGESLEENNWRKNLFLLDDIKYEWPESQI